MLPPQTSSCLQKNMSKSHLVPPKASAGCHPGNKSRQQTKSAAQAAGSTQQCTVRVTTQQRCCWIQHLAMLNQVHRPRARAAVPTELGCNRQECQHQRRRQSDNQHDEPTSTQTVTCTAHGRNANNHKMPHDNTAACWLVRLLKKQAASLHALCPHAAGLPPTHKLLSLSVGNCTQRDFAPHQAHTVPVSTRSTAHGIHHAPRCCFFLLAFEAMATRPTNAAT